MALMRYYHHPNISACPDRQEHANLRTSLLPREKSHVSPSLTDCDLPGLPPLPCSPAGSRVPARLRPHRLLLCYCPPGGAAGPRACSPAAPASCPPPASHKQKRSGRAIAPFLPAAVSHGFHVRFRKTVC